MNLVASLSSKPQARIHALLFLAALVAFFPPLAPTQTPSSTPAGPVPRTPDGKPDLSGTWIGERARHLEGIEVTAWGHAQYLWNTEPIIHQGYQEPIERQRIELDPTFHCYPSGMVRLSPPTENVGGGGPKMILQTPELIVFIYELRNSIRYIHLNEQEHPKPLELTWNGHSIGRWEGDTLVVDTVGLRDETWLTADGYEHSSQLHVVERFRRLDAGTLEVERTLADPVALAKPYTTKVLLKLDAKYDLDDNGSNDCTQYMVRKPGFGKGQGGLLGIAEHP